MEIPLKISGIQPETTVLLSSTFSTIYKPFHCPHCGNIVFEYNEDEVRTILPGGRPQIDKPGKIYRCNGVMTLHGTSRLYDILYQAMEAVFNMENVSDMRIAIGELSKTADLKFNARCKGLFYVS